VYVQAEPRLAVSERAARLPEAALDVPEQQAEAAVSAVSERQPEVLAVPVRRPEAAV
jgi:hypothetical protein